MSVIDVYQILGVARTSSYEEVRKAYQIARSRNHPDKGGNGEIFKKVNAAWELVNTPEKKSGYDRQFINRPEQKSNKSAFSGFGNYNRRQQASPFNQYAYRTPNDENITLEDILREYARQEAQASYGASFGRKQTPHKKTSKKTSTHTAPPDSIYRITLPNVESAIKLASGSAFSVSMGKQKRLIAELEPHGDTQLIIGKIYSAIIRGSMRLIPVIFNIKWKSPWSWDKEKGLIYTVSRVMTNVVKGGKLTVKLWNGNNIKVQWNALSPTTKSFHLRVKGKGWPSVNNPEGDLYIKFVPRKSPAKKK